MNNAQNIEKPLVSVIIRTCNRPSILRTALDSIRRQKYPNLEVIVVEDGKNISENMIRCEYSDLNINYYYTGEKKGRTRTGNIGLEKATGKYINFLDDDDAFYPQHIEILVEQLRESKYKAAYSIAEESQIVVKSVDPYLYKEKRRIIRYAQPFNKILLYHSNYIPIQSILFDRSLYQEFGGFDEKLDVLEDWDLWARYATHTEYIFVPEKTSVYFVPAVRSKKQNRTNQLHKAEQHIQNKFKEYEIVMNAGQVYEDMEFILKKYKTNQLMRYVRLVWNFLVYGEK